MKLYLPDNSTDFDDRFYFHRFEELFSKDDRWSLKLQLALVWSCSLRESDKRLRKIEVHREFEEAQAMTRSWRGCRNTSNQTEDRLWLFGNTEPDFDNLAWQASG